MGSEMPTILIIEDDGETRETLRELLSDREFDVVTAANGRAALELIRSGLQPRLVLLDLMMPEMNGWSFLEQLDRDLPIIIVSAFVHDAKTMTAAALLRRPIGFMTKPINVETLLDVVRQHCDASMRPSVEETRHVR